MSISSVKYRRPELLAPAGTHEMMHAAVENGADAIYFGLQEFNARIRAGNFHAEELGEVMAWLHERGVKGYVTMNTLVFADEIGEAAKLLARCSSAGVDAVLVQDLGIAALAARMVPDLPVHASTQMTLTAAESIEMAETLGLNLERVVAARETSIRELQALLRGTAMEIEVFVHGALCVAYSGQCLTSEALGGRSANRGECAQACRLPYDLVVDGELQDTGDVKYLLSPKDLAAYEDMDRLVETGIASLKIEGRLKSPQYVAATVQSYRAALDQVFATGNDSLAHPKMDDEIRRKLEMTFSRGFTGGYLHEINHQVVVEGRFPKKRGSYLGRVTGIKGDGVAVRLEGAIRAGDGIVFDAGLPDGTEEGGRIYEIETRHGSVKSCDSRVPQDVVLHFGRGALNFRRVNPGDRVWKTSDPHLDRELISSYDGEKIRWRRPVRMMVTARVGEPMKLELQDFAGHCVSATDTAPAEEAHERPLTTELLEAQLGRLGGTPFYLEELAADIQGRVMVPMSRLNELRRTAVEELLRVRRAPSRRRLDQKALHQMRSALQSASAASPQEIQLSVVCRTLDQVRVAEEHPDVHAIYTDFEDIRVHREARSVIRSKKFVPSTLRVMKPGEAGIIRKLIEATPDAVLVRNLGALRVLQQEAPGVELLGDYSLNVANDLTASLLMSAGLTQLTPSYDLNIDQLMALLRMAPVDWFEITVHQHLPMFHMEHCVFCRFLSDGTDFTNCGRPCESHTLELRDRMGYAHPVKADAGCRNTVYNAVAQSASEYLPQMLKAGVKRFRIEFITESADEVRDSINLYLPALRGENSGKELWRRLRAVSKLGVTRGSLDHE